MCRYRDPFGRPRVMNYLNMATQGQRFGNLNRFQRGARIQNPSICTRSDEPAAKVAWARETRHAPRLKYLIRPGSQTDGHFPRTGLYDGTGI